MLTLKGIRQYISELGIAHDDNVYIGKMDGKVQKSIGVYGRRSSGSPNIAIGGIKNTSYETKKISLLVHWSKLKDETEKVAYELFNRLLNTNISHIDDIDINYIRIMVPEPQDVGTDDNGIYEYVIWLDFIYQKGGNEQ